MALLEVRPFVHTILELKQPEPGLEAWNHVFEPEFHQARYVDACVNAAEMEGAFQLGDTKYVVRPPSRGLQPTYADDDDEPDTLEFEGMIDIAGHELDSANGTRNVCALKSISVRRGYLDFSVARSVSREFAFGRGKRAVVKRHDLLINSTGDGTIGRAAVYDEAFPSLVDGHVTIVRFRKSEIAWYTVAYLLTQQGQDQIYRFINGSSGQVEIYPQDIARLWIPGASKERVKNIATKFKAASRKHREFYKDMRAALNLLG